MSQSSDLIQSAQRTIQLEVEAVQGLLPHIDADFVRACEMILASKGRVVVVGMGKSGHIGQKIAASLAEGAGIEEYEPSGAAAGEIIHLRAEIDEVQRTGYSITIEQMRVGQFSLALPVVVEGQTIAAVGMVLDKGKIGEVRRLMPLLRGTVESIQASMSGRAIR